MKLIFSLSLLLAISSTSWAEIVIKFEPRAYLFNQVKDKIEHDTPYDIDLPFVDEAREKKFLPEQLSLDECLNWMIQYFEIENGLTLNYSAKEHRIKFQRASLITSEEQKAILDTQLKLKGHDWSIEDAILAANEQSNIQIKLPFHDTHKIKADYNYKCTMGEFIEEIRTYWLNVMGYRIHTSLSKKGITFFKGGTAQKNAKLQPMLDDLTPLNPQEIPQSGAPK